jgi:hypothetical protein
MNKNELKLGLIKELVFDWKRKKKIIFKYVWLRNNFAKGINEIGEEGINVECKVFFLLL